MLIRYCLFHKAKYNFACVDRNRKLQFLVSCAHAAKSVQNVGLFNICGCLVLSELSSPSFVTKFGLLDVGASLKNSLYRGGYLFGCCLSYYVHNQCSVFLVCNLMNFFLSLSLFNVKHETIDDWLVVSGLMYVSLSGNFFFLIKHELQYGLTLYCF